MKRRTPSDREDHDASAPIEAKERNPCTTPEAASEPAVRFYRRLALKFGTDVDLKLLLRNNRRPHRGPTIPSDPIQATTGNEP
ncbi:hypothetical protein BSQ44_19290 [Aquibium oceanicum]|uniref:Uncharacterized protein n=1 Tax=Aquibium oceanicum TaxID=1670800 RepID=A0A1L3SV16_9HYPH|nr:hypothetical protein [Aquibium oceanicum]APH73277.1 hypothetical protein BSQ44_19290 [Aquibium oceanicum]